MSENAATPPSGTSTPAQDAAVSYRHAVIFGLVFAGIVLVATSVMMRVWQFPAVFPKVALFTVGTFVAVGGFTSLLVWFDKRKKKPDEPPTYPILK